MRVCLSPFATQAASRVRGGALGRSGVPLKGSYGGPRIRRAVFGVPKGVCVFCDRYGVISGSEESPIAVPYYNNPNYCDLYTLRCFSGKLHSERRRV